MNTAKLRGKMREMSVTQEQLAKKMGMSLSTFSRKLNVENGETFTINNLNVMLEALSLSQEELSTIFFARAV